MRWGGVFGAAVLAAVVLAGCGDGSPGEPATARSSSPSLGTAEASAITVRQAWAAASLPMTSSGTTAGRASQLMTVGYAVIENDADDDDRLVRASSPIARDVQLHKTIETGQSAGTMKPVPHITVPSGDAVTLRPGGYHLMIMGLRHELRPGSSVPIQLEFASGTRLRIELPVIERADRPRRELS